MKVYFFAATVNKQNLGRSHSSLQSGVLHPNENRYKRRPSSTNTMTEF
jgi:hypothetical protein